MMNEKEVLEMFERIENEEDIAIAGVHIGSRFYIPLDEFTMFEKDEIKLMSKDEFEKLVRFLEKIDFESFLKKILKFKRDMGIDRDVVVMVNDFVPYERKNLEGKVGVYNDGIVHIWLY